MTFNTIQEYSKYKFVLAIENNIKEEYVTEKAKKFYGTYLVEKKDLWPVSDYSFYGVYHDLKIISNIKKDLTERMKKFWEANNVELLCAQTLNIDSFSISAFNISDFIIEIFIKYNDYLDFIKNQKTKINLP